MSSNGYYANPTTDLASILRTLASLTPQNQNQTQIHDQYPNRNQNQLPIATSRSFNEQSIDHVYPRPVETVTPNSQYKSAPTLEAFLPTAYNVNSTSQKKSVVTKNIVDPTCILEWPAGLLKAVGGVVSTLQPETNIKSTERELQTFDLKVYKAQMQMVREMNAKLRSLGVPFFGTRSDLVRPAAKKAEKVKGVKEIDEVDLVKLQRRMLEFLEDLCNG
ncbi:hypothetical protein EPUL_000334 [Erysiphe pulchra]|uniref:Uncharacterized protein n=1 Tax=Erysiphe pulchra TaxID=225359 RepID=A0A2S4Q1D3_9PEZI|nr:hypothetical protein EPUL_000334 [Erysiphe pulchra]